MDLMATILCKGAHAAYHLGETQIIGKWKYNAKYMLTKWKWKLQLKGLTKNESALYFLRFVKF